MTPTSRFYERLRVTWAVYVAEGEAVLTGLRHQSAVLAAFNPKAALATLDLALRVDLDGPAALNDLAPTETVDPTTAWEAASGLKFDAETRTRIDEVVARLARDELDRVDAMAKQRADAIAKAARHDRRRRTR